MKNKNLFFVIIVPFIIAYINYVYKTPGHVFNNSSPFWETGRILIFIFWVAVIYFTRWNNKEKKAWSPANFLIGWLVGGGFFFLYLAFARDFLQPQLANMAFISLLSGLFASSSSSYLRAALMSFVFLIMQIFLHELVFLKWSYIV